MDDAERRERGDHLLADRRAIARIVEAAGLQPGERVLDVGAGEGALTAPLAAAVAPRGTVVAVELDPKRVWALRGLGVPGLEVLEGDALAVPLPDADAVVANPPFRIAAPLVRRLAARGYGRMVLVLPDELAHRLAAQPGEEAYGKLSADVGLLARTEVLFAVHRRAFTPPPQVGCSVVRMVAKRPLPQVPACWDAVLEAAWAARGRTLRHALAPLARSLGVPPQRVTEALAVADVAGLRAPEVAPWRLALVASHLDAVAGQATGSTVST